MRKLPFACVTRFAHIRANQGIMVASIRKIHFVLDFDGTLTRNDTISALASAGYNSSSNTATAETWTSVADRYMEDLKSHTSNYEPRKEHRKTISQELAWLESLRDVERASYERVKQAGIFSNVTKGEIAFSAQQTIQRGDVVFRDEWLKLVHQSPFLPRDRTPCPVEVLSVNWSAYWVKSCMESAAKLASQQGIIRDAKLESSIVHANEICDFGNLEPSSLHSSKDKAIVLRQIMLGSVQTQPGSNRNITFYIGDSSTDLECLLSADIGCIIEDKPTSSGLQELYETLQRLEINVSNLINFNEHDCERVIHATVSAPAPELTDIGKEHVIWKIQNLGQVQSWLDKWTKDLETESFAEKR